MRGTQRGVKLVFVGFIEDTTLLELLNAYSYSHVAELRQTLVGSDCTGQSIPACLLEWLVGFLVALLLPFYLLLLSPSRNDQIPETLLSTTGPNCTCTS